MSLIELFLLAVGLSMDAFAVSVCKGLSMQKTAREARAHHRSVFWRFPGTHALAWLCTGNPFPGGHQSL